jgi:hypothetical protein
MRRIALVAASLIAGAALILFLVPARASPLTAAGVHKGAANGAPCNEGIQPSENSRKGPPIPGMAR